MLNTSKLTLVIAVFFLYKVWCGFITKRTRCTNADNRLLENHWICREQEMKSIDKNHS